MSPSSNSRDGRPGTWRSLVRALSSWRTAAVTLLSFSSGLPLGLVWISIPDWMGTAGIDIRIIGLTTLAHAPWTFKMLWSPLMDRFAPPWLGRRRGWIALTQILLFVLTLALAGLGNDPEAPWVVLAFAMAIAFASASQDIVIDAYAVDVLLPAERGIAVGARVALYRAAMQVAGAVTITLAGWTSWSVACGILALFYLPMLVVTLRAPEPAHPVVAPQTLRESVWLPFLGFLSRHRALEILAFVFLYKFSDQLAQSLMRPFFAEMGYDHVDRGIALGTVGFIGTVVGTFVGGALTTVIGLSRSLWIFGFLQIFSNVGYILVAESAVNRPLFYGAMGFETVTTGLGMGAFGVLLLRMTQKRFSATQYALFSSLFALPRLIAGPVTGVVVHAMGWTSFFVFTMLAGIPGLVMLARFSPWNVREPEFTVEPPKYRDPLSAAGLTLRAVSSAVAALVLAASTLAALAAMETRRESGGGFEFGEALSSLVRPAAIGDWMTLAGCVVFAAVAGLVTAAIVAARPGAGFDADAEGDAG
jgi:PAT family beta-lactamase induction signal transducer AmpG